MWGCSLVIIVLTILGPCAYKARKCRKNKWLINHNNVIISSVQSLSHVRLFATPWIVACQPSLSITNSWSSLKLMSIESVMPSSHLILCHPLLLLSPIPPSIRVFSNESTLHMKWPNHRRLYFFLFLLMTVNHVVWVEAIFYCKKEVTLSASIVETGNIEYFWLNTNSYRENIFSNK